jgi:hypothetical protein
LTRVEPFLFKRLVVAGGMFGFLRNVESWSDKRNMPLHRVVAAVRMMPPPNCFEKLLNQLALNDVVLETERLEEKHRFEASLSTPCSPATT